MTVLELLTLISRVSLLGIALITGLNYLQRRDPVRRDIFLTFLSLTASIWTQLFESVTGIDIPGRELLSQVLLVAQPYLMIRLIHYFLRVPRTVYFGSLAGMVVSWMLLIFVGTDQSPLVIVIVVGYFAVVDGYAAIAFVQGASRSTGVVRQRMRFAAAGSLLLITALILAGLNAIVPALQEFAPSLTQLCAIGCAIAYYLGFAPPRRLRQIWQDAELRGYLQHIDQTQDRTFENVTKQLEEAIKDGIGNNVRQVRIIESDAKSGELLQLSAVDGLEGSETASLRQILEDAWQKRSAQVVRRAKRGWFGNAASGEAEATLVIPLDTPRPLGLLVVELQRDSLFIDEDLALLRLFGQQAAVTLQNQQMREALLERNEALEQKVRARTADLERLNKELKSFAYVASHDLQEPLRTISSYLQLIEKRYHEKFDAEGHEFIAFTVDAAARMKALIQDVLAYSRVQTQPKNFTVFSTQAVVDEVCLLLENAINEAQAVITCNGLPTITADRRLILQLFQNLLSNAIKYRGDRKPEIEISAAQEAGDWHFRIRDNGIGIEAQYLEQIFTAFKRLHGREEYAGTGIGLAICRKAVELHAGRLWAESTPGEGSTFHFTLPIEPSEEYDVSEVA